MTADARPVRARLGRGFARLSLRTRLTALLVVLLFVSCAILTAVTAVGLHSYLVHRLDQQLVEAGNRYAVSLEHPSDHDADNSFSSVVGQATGTLGARILRGQVTAAGIVTDQDDLVDIGRRQTGPGGIDGRWCPRRSPPHAG